MAVQQEELDFRNIDLRDAIGYSDQKFELISPSVFSVILDSGCGVKRHGTDRGMENVAFFASAADLV